jgi:hypothetical protein
VRLDKGSNDGGRGDAGKRALDCSARWYQRVRRAMLDYTERNGVMDDRMIAAACIALLLLVLWSSGRWEQ